ncbi:hypothetical protein HY605_04385, partial [Candidatus Peregrinibacteria bacterium]|nr:hypothetical protein [Candidatus Peregrinibacteria bacterium]
PGVPPDLAAAPPDAPPDATAATGEPSAEKADEEAKRVEAEERAKREKAGKKAETLENFDQAREHFKNRALFLGPQMRKKGVLALHWQRDSLPAVDAMVKDWKENLNLPVDEPYYTKIIEALRKPFNNEKGDGQGPAIRSRGRDVKDFQPGNLDYYLNPFRKEHQDWLEGNDQTYLEAVQFVEEMKSVLMDQLKSKESIAKRKEEAKSDPVFREITDHVHVLGKDFARSWREKDYGSLALYGISAWAIWGTVQKLKAAGNGQYFDYLKYAAAAYGGYHLLKRSGVDVGKKLGMTDDSSDVKGTVFEHMAGVNVEGEGTMDMALLLALGDQNIAPYYQAYKKAGPSTFIHPADFPDAFGKLRLHRPRDLDNPRTQNEEIYVETGKKLFFLMQSVIAMYNGIPGMDKTFEERYGDPKAEFTFGDLGFLMSRYYDPVKEKSWFKRGDGLDKAKKDLEFLGSKKLGFYLESAMQGGVFRGYMKNIPVVVTPSPDGKSYRVRFFDSTGKPTEQIAAIPLTEGPAQDQAMTALDEKLKSRMKDLLTPLSVDSAETAPDVQYDGAKWFADIELAGAREFGLGKQKVKAYFYPLDNGQGVEVVYNGIRMPLNWAMEKAHPYKAPLISELVYSDPEYKEVLLPFVRSGELQLVDDKTDDGRFELVVGNMPEFKLDVSCKVEYDPTDPDKVIKREFLIEPKSAERLFNRVQFAEKYSEALNNSPEVEEIFKRFKSVLDNAPESFVWHFLNSVPGWFTNMTSANLLRGFSLSDFTGSIKDNQVNSILDARRELMKSRMMASARNAKSFRELKQAKNENFDRFVLELELLTNRFSAANLEKLKQGRDWNAVDFSREVFEPLQKSGAKSRSYASALSQFNADVYGFMYGRDDLRTKPHEYAGKLMTAFAVHTAYLDENLDNLELGLVGAALPDGDPKKEAQKTAVEGSQKLRYMKYVHLRLLDVATRKGDQVLTADPGDLRFWEIDDFQTWLADPNHANVEAMDILDTLPVLKHGTSSYIDFKEWWEIQNSELSEEERDKKIGARKVIARPMRGEKLPKHDDVGNKEQFDAERDAAIEQLTELESEYARVFREHIDYFRRNCADDMKVNALNAFERKFLEPRIVWNAHDFLKYPASKEAIAAMAKKNSTGVGEEARATPGKFVGPQLWYEADEVQQSLLTRTPSRGIQLDLIDKSVRRVIESEIFA